MPEGGRSCPQSCCRVPSRLDFRVPDSLSVARSCFRESAFPGQRLSQETQTVEQETPSWSVTGVTRGQSNSELLWEELGALTFHMLGL